MKLYMTKEQAKKFIELQETGDNIGLNYLQSILRTNEVSIPTTLFAENVVDAAICLNHCITQMEIGDIKYNGLIDSAYRDIMCELVESARAICEYEV